MEERKCDVGIDEEAIHIHLLIRQHQFIQSPAKLEKNVWLRMWSKSGIWPLFLGRYLIMRRLAIISHKSEF
jgi:hypothetical protein